jgi:hypothetical protein
MSRITIPANPGFYRLESWKEGPDTRTPIIGWRIYDTGPPRPVCIGIDLESNENVDTAILTPEGDVLDRQGNELGDEGDWRPRR